ncbi:TA system VapC family ribonuclease toxin [Saccharopolyspora gregorii]|uniref:TA system VapC family ribonuclease toxin n=1 Tax=Saccharopolyspora gregorii TaxID=33914 RepID=UPI0021ABFC43|nr:TA system VapC family ribonuclease toxin [Saccharopolyspora gregorii]
MIACDVNILVSAYNLDDPRQPEYADWLGEALSGPQLVGLPSLVLSGFMRIMTNRKILREPLLTHTAADLADELAHAGNVAKIEPGAAHWGIFAELCRKTEAKANHIPDAYLAAIAIEHGAEWITADRGFARYPGLRWRHPLD